MIPPHLLNPDGYSGPPTDQHPHTTTRNSTPDSPSRSTIVLTFAESKRKLALENDPRATDITPTSVRCNMCAAEIKLSPKSAYDNFHWKTHKERCMKKSKNPAARGPGGMYSLKRPGRKPDIISPHSARPIKTKPSARVLKLQSGTAVYSQAVSGQKGKPSRRGTRASSSESVSALGDEGSSTGSDTPPLTPDMHPSDLPSSPSSSVQQRSPTGTPAPPRKEIVVTPQIRDYLYRSHRREGPGGTLIEARADTWQDWKWSLLQVPIFDLGDADLD
ncbi:hypothetical protein BDV98DRAFT_288627 [Pterulicium gracile]|uniref:Uncharacterized protein n=1 Tax=Pterulicium gracile TaxID=1884261 RepID=A0A5C3QTK8_9AGAR|nr:hypothetical protein BDV98DRAFT_288627 [Pterula gracilis]